MKNLVVLFSCFLLAFSAFAQESRRFVWEAGLALDYKVLENTSMNTSIAQRTSFLEDGDNQYTQWSFLEINQFVTQKVNPSFKVSLGYKYRSTAPVEELDVHEHRFTQQLAYTHLNAVTRIVSRLRVEQRLRSSRNAHRFRYRISIDRPLSGEKIDPREFFLVASSEFLFEAENNAVNTWENRLSASLGYAVSKNMKADFTLTYRLEDINIETQGILFINTGLVIKLN